MHAISKIHLEAMTAADLVLRESIETDPRMMAELGGPNTVEQVKRAHSKALEMATNGTCWYLKVVAADSNDAVGYIGVWESFWNNTAIYEMGWMIRPEYQGKGFASTAGQAVLDKARGERKFKTIHAFPGSTNIASNKICAKLGFSNVEECDIEYQGRPLRCNNWRIELF